MSEASRNPFNEVVAKWHVENGGLDEESAEVMVALTSREQKLELLGDALFVETMNAVAANIKATTETWRWGEMPGDKTYLDEIPPRVEWATNEGPTES